MWSKTCIPCRRFTSLAMRIYMNMGGDAGLVTPHDLANNHVNAFRIQTSSLQLDVITTLFELNYSSDDVS